MENINTTEVKALFTNEITEQGLQELSAKYSNLALDMSSDADFKQARKIRTERNKITKAIKDRRIAVTSQLKGAGDELTSQVLDIFAPIVDSFEIEDQRRKEEAERIKAERENMLNEQRDKIRAFQNFVSDCHYKEPAYIAGVIESVDLIEVECFDKELIHEAIEAKASVLGQLSSMLENAKAKQQHEAEQKAINIERRIAKLKQIPVDMFGHSSASIKAKITAVKSVEITEAEFADQTMLAREAVATVLAQLDTMLKQQIEMEAFKAQQQKAQAIEAEITPSPAEQQQAAQEIASEIETPLSDEELATIAARAPQWLAAVEALICTCNIERPLAKEILKAVEDGKIPHVTANF